jgi:hypothetical protein
VNYVKNENILLVTSYRHRTWWRNLHGGVPVTVRVRGRTLKGLGKAITREAEVIEHLQTYLQQVPTQAKYFNVVLDPNGNPNLGDIVKAAKDRVGISIQLKT